MSKSAVFAVIFTGLVAASALAQTTSPPIPSTPTPTTPPAAAAPATPAAPAAASPAAVNYRQVCGKEVRQICGPSPKGDKQARSTRRECVVANKAKFSADCQAAIDTREADRLARKDTRRNEKQKL